MANGRSLLTSILLGYGQSYAENDAEPTTGDPSDNGPVAQVDGRGALERRVEETDDDRHGASEEPAHCGRC